MVLEDGRAVGRFYEDRHTPARSARFTCVIVADPF